jgi:hypothetical protein
MEPGSTFCGNCGRSYSSASTVAAQPVYAAPAPAQAPAPQINYFNSGGGYPNTDYRNIPLTVGQYIVMFLVLGIPLVGQIMMLVWAFGSDVNRNKKNFCIAALLMGIIIGVLYGLAMLVMVIIAGASGAFSGF